MTVEEREAAITLMAEALHFDTYVLARTGRPELDAEPPEPNSKGYQVLWPGFLHDAEVCLNALDLAGMLACDSEEA